MIEVLDGPGTWQRIRQAAAQAKIVQIGVAYITTDQLAHLLPALKATAKRKKAEVGLLCGIGDLRAQAPTALQQMEELARQNPTQVTFGIVPPSSGLFHPKYYYFDDGHRADIFIGSSNLTSRAFGTNTECNIHLSVATEDALARNCRHVFNEWLGIAKEATDLVQKYVQLENLYAEASRLQASIEQLTEQLGQSFKEAPALQPRPQRPPSAKSRVADLLAAGHIGEVEVAATRFHITIDSRLGGKTGPAKKTVGNLEVVDQRSIRWYLLDQEDAERLRKLRNSILFDQRDYTLQTPWGAYISATLFCPWLSWVQERNRAFANFEQEAVQSLRGRQREKLDEFKRDFYKLLPEASKTTADTIAQEVRIKFQALVSGQTVRQSLLHPRWRSASTLAFPSPLPTDLQPGLQAFARDITADVGTHDLAQFAQAACKRARNFAATAFKAGSQKKTIVDALSRLEQLNFYKDAQLLHWSANVEEVAARIPEPGDWLSPREIDWRKAEAKEQLTALIAQAAELEGEVQAWANLPSAAVLEAFVKCYP